MFKNSMIIYKTTNLINSKIYIGQDSKDNPNYFGSGIKIRNAIKKYGRKNFKKEILKVCKSQKELDCFEFFFIKKFDSTNKNIGYNILSGTSNNFGSGSPMMIKESVKKMIKTKKNFSKEKKKSINRKISKSQRKRFKKYPESRPIGEKNGMFGKQHTKERKQRIGDSVKKAFKKYPEILGKISESSKKFWRSMGEKEKEEFIYSRCKKNKKKSFYVFYGERIFKEF